MALTTDQRDLLATTMDFIEQHPDRWDQYIWGRRTACGTAACFAGWAVLIARPECQPPLVAKNFAEGDYREVLDDGSLGCIESPWRVDGIRDVQTEARTLLGLSCDQAGALFAADNTLAEIKAMVQLLLDTDGQCYAGTMYDAGITAYRQAMNP